MSKVTTNVTITELLEQVEALIVKCKGAELEQTKFLLQMVHLDLETKLRGIPDEELVAFTTATQPTSNRH